MTRTYEDPRLTAYALGELDAEELQQLEAALSGDAGSLGELEEIRRVATLVEREFSTGTGLGLSARQRLQLQQAWRERNAAAGESGALGEARAQPQGPLVRHVMFEDFASSARNPRARKRFAKSVAAAIIVYGTASAVLVMASATVRKLVGERLSAIEFAQTPAPEPEAVPPLPVKSSLAPKTKRLSYVAAPHKASNDKSKEPGETLAGEGENNAGDRRLDSVASGTGMCPAAARTPTPTPTPALAPAMPAEPLTPPAALGGADRYQVEYSSSARRKGIEGKVVVSFVVLEDGSVANVRTLSGPPELRGSVLKAVPAWRFKPAQRGSKPIRYSMTKTLTFRLEDP